MKRRKVTLLALSISASGCTMGYQADSRFQSWLSQTEERCAALYGTLPFDGSAARAQFENLSYQTYYNDIPSQVYVDRLNILYPNHRLTINCLATAFPKW